MHSKLPLQSPPRHPHPTRNHDRRNPTDQATHRSIIITHRLQRMRKMQTPLPQRGLQNSYEGVHRNTPATGDPLQDDRQSRRQTIKTSLPLPSSPTNLTNIAHIPSHLIPPPLITVTIDPTIRTNHCTTPYPNTYTTRMHEFTAGQPSINSQDFTNRPSRPRSWKYQQRRPATTSETPDALHPNPQSKLRATEPRSHGCNGELVHRGKRYSQGDPRPRGELPLRRLRLAHARAHSV